MKKTKSNNTSTFNIIAALVLGILAIICFIIQILSIDETTSQNETTLFNILQFLLTTGFSWFGARIINEAEFVRNLKSFAISAYRRILDIDNVLLRLKTRLNYLLDRESSGSGQIEVIYAIVEDMKLMINSSKSDWSDVIGNEMITLENIKRLEKEKEEIEFCYELPGTSNETDKNDALEKEILHLKEKLPSSLKVQAESKETRSINIAFASDWLRREHRRDNGLILRVVSGKDYGNFKEAKNLNSESEIYSTQGSDHGLDIIDNNKVLIGRILNKSPMDYDGYKEMFKKCYGSFNVKLSFVEVTDIVDEVGEQLIWFKVKVLDKPLQKGKNTTTKK